MWWTARLCLLATMVVATGAFITSTFTRTVAIWHEPTGSDTRLRYLVLSNGAVSYQWVLLRGTVNEPAVLSVHGAGIAPFAWNSVNTGLGFAGSIRAIRPLPEFDRGNPWRNMKVQIGYMPDADGEILTLPLWPVLPIALVVTPLLTRRLSRDLVAWRRGERGCCASCGYDLRSTPERCPECGAEPVRLSTPVVARAFRGARGAWRDDVQRRVILTWARRGVSLAAIGAAFFALRAAADFVTIRLVDAPEHDWHGPTRLVVWLAIASTLFAVALGMRAATRSRA